MKNKAVYWFVTVTLLIIMLYVIVCNVIQPIMSKDQLLKTTSNLSEISVGDGIRNKGNEVKTEDNKKKISVNVLNEEPIPDSIFAQSERAAHSKLFDLKKSENFLHSRVNIVNDDSSYLVLDLMNKTFTLEMKGILLYECHIKSFNIASSIKDQPDEDIIHWMAEPFYLKHIDATIQKGTLKEMIAPKDTVEANKKDETPRIPKRDDVYLVMDFDRDLRLIIRQIEKPDKEGQGRIDSLQWKYRKFEILNNLHALIHFNGELIKPRIEIVLPKEDATILYLALPNKPKLLLRI